MDPRLQIAIGFRVDRLFGLVIFNVHDCRSVGVYLHRVFQRHWYWVDIRR